MNLILADLIYSFRHLAGKYDLFYDVFTKKIIANMHNLANLTLHSDGHERLFYFTVQLLDWPSTLQNEQERYHPLMAMLNMQCKKKVVSNLKRMISSTSRIMETICNIHRKVFCTKSTTLSVQNNFGDPDPAWKSTSRAWNTTPFPFLNLLRTTRRMPTFHLELLLSSSTKRFLIWKSQLALQVGTLSSVGCKCPLTQLLM